MSPSIDPSAPLSARETSRSLWFTGDALLGQCEQLLADTLTTDQQLSHTSKLIPGSTIGKHLRHLIQHFELALQALQDATSSTAELAVCYDTRLRDLASETSLSAASEAFAEVRGRLRRLTGEGRTVEGGRKVRLKALTPECVVVESTWDRELWFCGLHATHHLALLRVIATGELGLELGPDFGVAPSTLSFRAGEVASVPGSGGVDAAKL